MFDLDKLIDKLLPDIATKRDERASTTRQVVEHSTRAREHSKVAVAEAYDAAGKAYGKRK